MFDPSRWTLGDAGSVAGILGLVVSFAALLYAAWTWFKDKPRPEVLCDRKGETGSTAGFECLVMMAENVRHLYQPVAVQILYPERAWLERKETRETPIGSVLKQDVFTCRRITFGEEDTRGFFLLAPKDIHRVVLEVTACRSDDPGKTTRFRVRVSLGPEP